MDIDKELSRLGVSANLWTTWQATPPLRWNRGTLEQLYRREKLVVGYGVPFIDAEEEWNPVAEYDDEIDTDYDPARDM